MKSSAAADPNRLRIVDLTATCKHCVALGAEIERLQNEIERLNRALQRESYVMDSREPHRRKV